MFGSFQRAGSCGTALWLGDCSGSVASYFTLAWQIRVFRKKCSIQNISFFTCLMFYVLYQGDGKLQTNFELHQRSIKQMLWILMFFKFFNKFTKYSKIFPYCYKVPWCEKAPTPFLFVTHKSLRTSKQLTSYSRTTQPENAVFKWCYVLLEKKKSCPCVKNWSALSFKTPSLAQLLSWLILRRCAILSYCCNYADIGLGCWKINSPFSSSTALQLVLFAVI